MFSNEATTAFGPAFGHRLHGIIVLSCHADVQRNSWNRVVSTLLHPRLNSLAKFFPSQPTKISRLKITGARYDK